jgi:DNA (cytosine-5)-methyltransferase 1
MIRIGTDCSGIEAPIQALKKLGIKYDHIFSCDIDKYAKKSMEANYTPKNVYDDIITQKKEHNLDMYVCGFPCQPFSMAGNRLGQEDKRGNIFNECVKNIKNTNTKVFVLENVKGILSINNGEYWTYIKNTLNELEKYNIYHKVLNTKDYGIPQNRERVYIIGIRKDIQKETFNYPKKIKCTNIMTFIEKSYTEKNEYSNTFKKSFPQFKNSIFANLSVLRFKNVNNKINPNYCPTITAGGELWCVYMHRRATLKELLSLQGFPKDFKQVVSNTQFKKQIGNSMSVNVLEKLFIEIFKCTDIYSD